MKSVPVWCSTNHMGSAEYWLQTGSDWINSSRRLAWLWDAPSTWWRWGEKEWQWWQLSSETESDSHPCRTHWCHRLLHQKSVKEVLPFCKRQIVQSALFPASYLYMTVQWIFLRCCGVNSTVKYPSMYTVNIFVFYLQFFLCLFHSLLLLLLLACMHAFIFSIYFAAVML